MKNSFWDERYGKDFYAYGTEPNRFFKKFIDPLPPGKILLPGEGEGRNAVYAAMKGWEVIAIDQSPEGKRKAEKLAREKQVSIAYSIIELTEFSFQPEEYDAIAMIFLHLSPEIRLSVHRNFVRSLKKGGHLLAEAFGKDQLGLSSGGPQVREMLYDEIILAQDFQQLEVIELYQTEEVLDEGPFHQGNAHLVRFIGRK